MITVTLIFHIPDPGIQSNLDQEQLYHSIRPQLKSNDRMIVFLDNPNGPRPNWIDDSVMIIKEGSFPEKMNLALKAVETDSMIYMDNRLNPIMLSQSALDLFRLSRKQYPKSGMVYADYELDDKGVINDIRLLKHHAGRTRDNQDYGRVFLFNVQALKDIGLFDEKIQFSSLYDIRLKLAEKYELIHIANKYSGALYRVTASQEATNVFDYLLAGKEQQSEAELVLTDHLKRIGAYLSPEQDFKIRPQPALELNLAASIIIPVNNRPDFISTAIESIWAQTIKEIEVIVVINGGPDDPTIDAVDQYREGGERYDQNQPSVISLVTDINNIGFCLNLGVEYARGKYYVQLDSDDRLKPNAVETIMKVFESDPRIGMVIGSYEVWEKLDNGKLVRMKDIPVVTHDEWTEDNGRNNLLRINGAGAPRSIPMEVIRSMGYFGMNEEPFSRNYGEDYDMVLRISEWYRIGRIYDPIYEVIRHSGGTDHSIDQETVDRNDEAKDWMRLQAIRRRQKLNRKTSDSF